MKALRSLGLCVLAIFLSFDAVSMGTLTSPTLPVSKSFDASMPLDAFPQAAGLARLLDAALPPDARMPQGPVDSLLLGEALTPDALVAQYAQRAQDAPEPVRDALEAWSLFMGAAEDPAELEKGIGRAGEWPRPVQEAIAVLLFALTDASHLQSRALDGLSDAEIMRLIQELPDVVRLSADELGLDGAQDVLGLAALVDMSQIIAGASLMVQAVDQTLPTLQAWADGIQTSAPERERLQRLATGLGSIAAQSTSGQEASLLRAEQVLRLAGETLGLDPPSPAPKHPSTEPGSSLGRVAAAVGVSLEGSNTKALDALPLELAQAVGAILEAYATLAAPNPGSMSTQFGSYLHLMETIRLVSPTLKKWTLIYEHLGPGLPKSEPASLASFLPLAQIAASPDAPADAIVRLAGMLAGSPPIATSSGPAPGPPSLVEEVRRMYAFHGVPTTPADHARIETGAAHLPPVVAAEVASLMRALNDAEASLAEAERRIAETHRPFFESGGPARAARALAAAAPTWADVDALNEFFSIVDELQAVTHSAASAIMIAADNTQKNLAGSAGFHTLGMDVHVEPQASAWDTMASNAHQGLIWFLDHFTPLGLLGTVSAQAPNPGLTCPAASPLSICENDIWFADPVLKWVIVGGFERTTYDPAILRGGITRMVNGQEQEFDARGQMLTLDLGGDDVYRNNAGGVLIENPGLPLGPPSATTPIPPSRTSTYSFRAALALDLAGNDRYEPPPQGFEQRGIQGAGIGGIGIQWDVGGDDSYTAGTEAQGYGSGSTTGSLACPPGCAETPMPGFGMLIDSAGNDRYVAFDSAQGAGRGFALTASVLTGPGTGILFDRAGDDAYRILVNDGLGIGAGQRGIGLLLDAGGDDTYLGGLQGDVPRSPATVPRINQVAGCATGLPNCANLNPHYGLGILLDLDGTDSYARQNPSSGQRMRDGDCWTSLSAPQKDVLEDAWVADQPVATAAGATAAAPTPQAPVADDTYSNTRSQLGIFVDLPSEKGPCRYEPAPLVPPAANPLPSASPPDAERVAANDTDGDGWSDGIEYLLGTDPHDPNAFPAAWPARPPSWPEAAPYPPVEGALPAAQTLIIDIPGLLAVGDTTDGHYPPSKDYAVLIDLGGNDTYQNRVGGSAPSSPGVASLVLDLGGNDQYWTPAGSLGSNGILIDFAGDDHYASDGKSMGYATPIDPRRLALGLLLDLRGNDHYESNGIGMGAVDDAIAPSHVIGQQVTLGILLDVEGDDTYSGPTQGYARAGARMPSTGLGLFVDLQGNDAYAPVGEQGRTTNARQTLADGAFAQLVAGGFFDGNGWDSYLLDNQRGGHFDASRRFNNAGRITTQNEESARDFPPSLSGAASPVQTLGLRIDTNATAGARPPAQCAEAPDPSNAAAACPSNDPFLLAFPNLGIAIADDTANNVHLEDYALLIDAGGDDFYLNNAGASLFRLLGPTAAQAQDTNGPHATLDQPISMRPSPIAALSIDLGGDDRYDGMAHSGYGQSYLVNHGLGQPGPPIVVGPAQGVVPTPPSPFLIPTDVRRGTLVQGAGFLGSGFLIDTHGDDTYTAHALSQGAGAVGVGLLWDRRGGDTYAFSPHVVGAPALDGIIFVHETLLGDRWTLSSNPSLPGESRHPVVAAGRLVYQSDSTGEWKVYVDDDPLNPNPVQLDAGSGDQVLPRTDGQGYVWQDNAQGAWRVRFRTLDTAPRNLDEGSASSSQINADVNGNWAVWQDDRNGTWDIRGRDLLRNSDIFIADDPSAQETQPRVFGSWVAWTQVPTSGIPLISARNLVAGELVTLAEGPGLVSGPVVGDGFVLFVDHRPTGDVLQHFDLVTRRLATLVGTTNAPCILGEPSRIGGIAIDSSHPGQAAFTVQRAGATASLPAGTPLTTIRSVVFADPDSGRQAPESASCLVRVDPNVDLGSTLIPSDLSTKPGSSIAFLQGAVAQQGRGLLIDEGGSDIYDAAAYSQAAGRSVDVSRLTPVPAASSVPVAIGAPAPVAANAVVGANLRPQPDQAMVALLADLGGNDRYSVGSYGQGAHDMVTGYRGVSTTEPELQSATITLLDLQGNDEYRANQFAQGWAGLTLGHWAASLSAVEGAPSITVKALTYADADAGTLLDLGGRDVYAYGANSDIEFRVTQDADGTIHVDPDISVTSDDVPVNGSPLPTCPGIFSMEECDALGPAFDLAAPSDGEPGGRNNRMWSQRGTPVRGADASPPENSADSTNRCVGTPSMRCPPVLVVGGVGIDREVTGPIRRIVHGLLPESYELQVSSTTLSSHGTLGGDSILKAEVRQREVSSPTGAPLLEAQGVDFFVRPSLAPGAPTMLGRGVPMPSIGCQFCIRWATDLGSVPDGEYEVVAQASFGSEASGIPLAELTASQNFRVDNPPRVTLAPIQVREFSPHPFDPARPRQFTMTATVSQDLDPQAKAQVELRLIQPTTGATVASIPVSATPGSPFTVAWDGSTPTGLAPDGTYRALLVARDKAGHETIVEDRVRLDATSPDFTCVRLASDAQCNPGRRDAPAGVNVQNAVAETSGATLRLVVPLTFEALGTSGSPEARYRVFTRSFSGMSVGPWTLATETTAPTVAIAIPHGQTVEVAVLAEDAEGNLECASACRASRSRPTFAQSQILDVVVAKQRGLFLGDGLFVAGTAVLRADAVPPVLLDPTLNGLGFQEVSLPRFGPSSRVAITGTATESDSPPASGRLTLISIEDPQRFQADLQIHGAPTTQPNHYAFQWDAWPETVRDWPEGVVAYLLIAQDAAANPSAEIRGQMLLDRTPPELQMESIRIEYPHGRQHAVTGDAITVWLAASDPPLLLHALQPDELRITLDASQVASSPVPVESNCAQGSFPASAVPMCFDGFEFFRATIPMGSILSPPAGGSTMLAMDVRLDDGLGNVHLVTGAVPVIVGEPDLGIGDVNTETDAGSATITWTTAKPARGAVKWAREGGDLGPEVPAEPSLDGTAHRVVLPALDPATAFRIQILAYDPSTGVAEVGAPFTILTSTGLSTTFEHPLAGDAVAGEARIRWTTTAATSVVGSIEYELFLVPEIPGAVPKQLDQFEGGPESRDFLLLASGLPDGAYHLLLKTALATDDVETRSGVFLVDNTPPTILSLQPRPGSPLGSGAFHIGVRSEDATSGIDCDSTTGTLNQQPLVVASCEQGVLAFHHFGALRDGSNDATVAVRDIAGNVRRAAWTFTFDEAGPVIDDVVVEYPLAQGAAKPGDLITIRANVTSHAGVRMVRLDAAEAGLADPVGLEATSTHGWTGYFTVPSNAPAGMLDVDIVSHDVLGRTAHANTLLEIKSAPPALLRLDFAPSHSGSPRVIVETNEDATVELQWESPAGETIIRTRQAEPLFSSRPGDERFGADIGLADVPVPMGTPFKLLLTDRAGNVASHHGAFSVLDLGLAPVAPTNLRILASADGIPRLEWVASPNPVLGYVVYRVDDETGASARTFVGNNTRWAEPERPLPGHYRYYVTSLDESGREGAPGEAMVYEAVEGIRLEGFAPRPSRGTTQTQFRFAVAVTDAHERTPTAAWLLVDGIPYELQRVGAGPCEAACMFQLTTALPATNVQVAVSKFHYEVDAGSTWLRYPVTGELDGPTVVGAPSGDTLPPAVPAGPGVFVALVVAAILFARRRIS